MSPLDDLARELQQADTLPDRMRILDEIVHHVGPALRGYLNGACRGQPEEAEDLYMETLRALVLGWPKFRSKAEGGFRRWCLKIARNKFVDWLREKQRTPVDLMEPDELEQVVDASAQVAWISPGDRIDLEYAINLLRAAKPPCDKYLRRHYLEDQDYDAMAEEFGVPAKTMQKRTSRCVERARALVNRRSKPWPNTKTKTK